MNILTSDNSAVNYDRFGVPVSPLGKGRATIDTIYFRQFLENYRGDKFGFRIGQNLYVRCKKINQVFALDVFVYSLSRFANNRSSSLIRDYSAVLVKLAEKINRELKKREKRIDFRPFESEITRLDLFSDLRFKSKQDARTFYKFAAPVQIPDLPLTTIYERGFYKMNGLDLATSSEILKLYDKENKDRKFLNEELNRNKLRLEVSYQNKCRSKPLVDFVKQNNIQSFSGIIETGNKTFLYQNKHLANCFSIISQDVLDELFYLQANKINT